MKFTKLGLALLVNLPLVVAAFAEPSQGGEAEDRDSASVTRLRKSVASLIGYADGKEFRATGFVVERPGDSKKLILTAGHIFRKKMVLYARLPGMKGKVECDLIAVSAKHDLMAVAPHRPIEAPALPLLASEETQPKLNDRVVLIGCPGGLDWTLFKGEINADPITAHELQTALGTLDLEGQKTPNGDALLLRHSTFSFPGMSGGPLIDTQGQVIGVQLGTLPKASNVSFAVHAQHLRDLDLSREPRLFAGGPKMDSDIANVLAIQRPSNAPFLIRIGDEDVDVRCFHFGYVPNDAETVITKYIQDEERFREFFTKGRLQALLATTRVAHITNPAFGFRVLVPKGYMYRIEELKRPRGGILVAFTSGDPAIAAPYNTITVRAFPNTTYLSSARRTIDEGIRTGRIKFPEKLTDTPLARYEWRRGLLEGAQVGTVSTLFPYEELDIRVKDERTGKTWGKPEAELFLKRTTISGAFPNTCWARSNYDAEDGPHAHAVHCANREDVIVVVHYQFQKKDRETFLAGEGASSNFLERAFIAATVSLY